MDKDLLQEWNVSDKTYDIYANRMKEILLSEEAKFMGITPNEESLAKITELITNRDAMRELPISNEDGTEPAYVKWNIVCSRANLSMDLMPAFELLEGMAKDDMFLQQTALLDLDYLEDMAEETSYYDERDWEDVEQKPPLIRGFLTHEFKPDLHEKIQENFFERLDLIGEEEVYSTITDASMQLSDEECEKYKTLGEELEELEEAYAEDTMERSAEYEARKKAIDKLDEMGNSIGETDFSNEHEY